MFDPAAVGPALPAETLVGPFSLSEALAAAEPGPGGVRVAVSSPESTFVAFQVGKAILVRRVCLLSGRGGSRLETGSWEDVERVRRMGWRPA